MERYVRNADDVGKFRVPYVTTTAPLALTQASKTWSAVALSRRAISLTGLSTGPPGWRVIGLFGSSASAENGGKSKGGVGDVHQGRVGLGNDALCHVVS
jgi:hypothetical protein